MRPYSTSQFALYNAATFEKIYSVDAATSFDYQIPGDRTVKVRTRNVLLKEKETYFVALDHGFATNTKKCGIESVAIRDTAFWNFTISKFHFWRAK